MADPANHPSENERKTTINGRPHAETPGIETPDNGKDLAVRYLATISKGSAFFDALHLNLPPIEALLPTALPAIEASDSDTDMIFLLEDHSYLIMEFESHAGIEEFHKHMKYFIRFVCRYETPNTPIIVRFIVVYTSDVEKSKNVYKNGPMQFTVEQCFLSSINGSDEFNKIKNLVNHGVRLSQQDLFMLALLPLTEKGILAKQQMLDQVLDTAMDIKQIDSSDAAFVLSASAVALRNYVTQAQLERIKEAIKMTPLGEMLNRELKQKDELIEQKDKLLQEQNEVIEKDKKEMANLLVSGVENLIRLAKLQLEDACKHLGFSINDYLSAKALLAAN